MWHLDKYSSKTRSFEEKESYVRFSFYKPLFTHIQSTIHSMYKLHQHNNHILILKKICEGINKLLQYSKFSQCGKNARNETFHEFF